MEQDKHIQAFKVANYAYDLMKNDERLLLTLGFEWSWGAIIFLEG